MAIGQDVYEGDSRLVNFTNNQGANAITYGSQAARLADPVMDERKQYAARLLKLIENPGGQETSPYFQYLRDTQMNAVRAKNAATGDSATIDANGNFKGSGRGAMALQDRAAGVATAAYFPQVQALSRLAGFDTSSPTGAANAFIRGTERGQDYQSMGAAQRAAGAAPKAPASFWSPDEQQRLFGMAGGGSYGLPTGGSLPYELPYAPSPGSGTGYMTSDAGTTNFYNPQFKLGNWDMSNDPYASTAAPVTRMSQYGSEGRYPPVGNGFNPAQPYGDYTQGGYE